MNQTIGNNQFPFGSASPRTKRTALWIGGIWLIGGGLLMRFLQSGSLRHQFTTFNQAAINAPIESISTTHHGRAVQLRVSGSSYRFYPVTNTEKNGVLAFIKLAQVGDYVKRSAESDTL